MSTITLAKEFDISNVSASDIRTLDNGGKVAYMSYNGAPLILQTPTMTAPFGLSTWDNDGKGPLKYSLDLSFKGMDRNAGLQTFYNVLEAIDKRMIDDGLANAATWFKGKKVSKDVLEALYTPLIRHAKDKNGDITDKYPPTFKVTVPNKEGKPTCEVYDEKRNIVDLMSLQTKGSRVMAIVQWMGLWFAGGKYGTTWKVLQMKVVPNATIRGYAFKEVPEDNVPDEEDLDENGGHADPKEVMELAMNKHEEDAIVSSSDEDDDDGLPRRKKLVGRKV
jgi:hypothetical protein